MQQQDNKRYFTINRDMFQGEEILKQIKEETNTKQIDIIFGVYATLEYSKNLLGVCGVSLKHIESQLYNSSKSRNIKVIKDSIKILKEHNVIDYDIEIDDVKPNDYILINMVEYKQYMQVFQNDFDILSKLDSNFFLIYSMINNFHNDTKGYSFIGYERMGELLSTKTVSKHLNIAYCLNIFDITVKGDGWVYDSSLGKARKSNNMYAKNEEGIEKVVSMSKEEISKEIEENIDKVQIDKHKANIYRWLDERDLTYTTDDVEQIMFSVKGTDKLDIMNNIKITDTNDIEFENAIIVYHFNKYITKANNKQKERVQKEVEEKATEMMKNKQENESIQNYISNEIIEDESFKIGAKAMTRVEDFINKTDRETFEHLMYVAKLDLEESGYTYDNNQVKEFNVIFKKARELQDEGYGMESVEEEDKQVNREVGIEIPTITRNVTIGAVCSQGQKQDKSSIKRDLSNPF